MAAQNRIFRQSKHTFIVYGNTYDFVSAIEELIRLSSCPNPNISTTPMEHVDECNPHGILVIVTPAIPESAFPIKR